MITDLFNLKICNTLHKGGTLSSATFIDVFYLNGMDLKNMCLSAGKRLGF